MARMLVIDDDPTILSLVSSALEASGHTVVTAPDGRVGLARFQSEAIDLIITDIVMPDQEGMATIGAIRRASPRIPILAMSGSNTMGRYGNYLDAAKLLGASATISKPFTVDDLIAAVAALLSSS